MFEKLKQIWRILFPPKPKPKPKLPPRPDHSLEELVQRGEELKEYYHQQKQAEQTGLKPCPGCRANVKEIHTCAKCGKPGCDYCMVFDPMERKYYCDGCWNE